MGRRRGKKARTLLGALPGRERPAAQPSTVGKNLKNRPLTHAPVREEIIVNQSPLKGRQSRSTELARDCGSIVVGTKPRGRTVDSNIANDEKRVNTKLCGSLSRPNNPHPLTQVASLNVCRFRQTRCLSNVRRLHNEYLRQKLQAEGNVQRSIQKEQI